MVLQRSEIAEIPAGPPVRPRGILALAAPAPEGWEAGGIQVLQLCPSIRMEDQCVTFDDRSATRPNGVNFPAFSIEQSAGCSTMSAGDREREARDALDASTDYALGLAISSATFNSEAPSLADATDLGASANATAALAKLEGAASRDGKGQLYVVHATPSAAIYLANAGLLSDSGQTPTGATVIISAGYETENGDLRLWATGRVWAGVGPIATRDGVDRRTNNREAWALRSAVVGFNSCINLTASFTAA